MLQYIKDTSSFKFFTDYLKYFTKEDLSDEGHEYQRTISIEEHYITSTDASRTVRSIQHDRFKNNQN